MTVTPLTGSTAAHFGDDAPSVEGVAPPLPVTEAFTAALERTSDALTRADGAERAFIAGRGGLQELVLERAQADIALAVAGAAASRAAQSLSTILGMQV